MSVLERINLENEKLKQADMEALLGGDDFGNLAKVFRDCYDVFQDKLDNYEVNRRLAKRTGRSGLKEIQKLLIAAGVFRESDGMPLELGHISSLMNKVRAEKNILNSKNVKPSPPNPTEKAFAKHKLMSGGVVPSLPESMPTPVVISAPYVRPKAVSFSNAGIKMREYIDAMKLDAPWTAVDEFFLVEILFMEEFKSKNLHVINGTFWTEMKSSTFTFSSDQYRSASQMIEERLKRLRIWEHYKDMK